ncbi:MAG: arginyl-tRNA--protein-N-Asp/Glu arginylyltransferase [Planctomycetota bacterium]
MNSEDLQNWRGSLSPPEDCPYLEGQVWENFILDPGAEVSSDMHEHLLESGFRRMGSLFFQPACKSCNECRTMRLATQTFQPSKSLRRARNKNLDLVVTMTEPNYTEEKRALLGDYLTSRHVGPMIADEEGVREFMFSGSGRAKEMTYYMDGELIAVGLVDVLPNIVSSLYFFYKPTLSRRSLGIASMMFEIEWAQKNGREWYHPGFMVRDCPAMSYKARFGPAEVLGEDGEWLPLDVG